MNVPTIFLAFGGCCLYVYAMSALGRWLAVCSEMSSTVYTGPIPSTGMNGTFSLRS